MACSHCHKTCENPRTIYCEYERDECVLNCECLNLPVGSILDWPIDYSDILGCEDPHVIDETQSTVTITQTNGPNGPVAISNIDYDTEVMTAWIDATQAVDGAYYELEAVMVSDKGRRITHKLAMTAKEIKC